MLVTKRADTASGATWLRRADALARSIPGRFGVRREIIDGYIVEGKRTGSQLTATVVDPPSYVYRLGSGLMRVQTEMGGGQEFYFYGSSMPYPRDALHWEYGAQPPPINTEPSTLAYAGRGARLRLRPDIPDQEGSYINRDAGWSGLVQSANGFASITLATGSPYTVGGRRYLMFYRDAANPVYWEFFTQALVGALRVLPATGSAPVPNDAGDASALGLSLDSDWIDAHVGGGRRVVPLWPDPAGLDGLTSPSLWSSDSVGFRWQAPWVRAVQLEQSPTHVVWRVLTRVALQSTGVGDAWGLRQLATFDVRVALGGESAPGTVDATPVGGVTLYNPALSTGDRAPNYDAGAESWGRNTFASAVTAPNGVMVAGHSVAVPGMATSSYFFAVLLNSAGQFIELELGSTARSVAWFAGGDVVDGVTLMVNPFLDAARLAVVNGTTGAVTFFARPAWFPPLRPTPLDPMDAVEDVMHNTVCYIGNGKLVFPVSDATGGGIQLGGVDTRNGVVYVAGAMFTQPRSRMWGGVARVVAVQYEDDGYPAEAGSRGAILIGGYNSGYTEQTEVVGETVVSYDSGATWAVIDESYGPGRGSLLTGNALYWPTPGALWGG